MRILAAAALVVVTTGAAVAADVTPQTRCEPYAPFGRDGFTRPTTIDNQYLPLVPGTRFILEGRANRTGEPLAHQVIFTVTDLTKVINGVRSRVMHDVDVNNGRMVEEELSFFVQDDAGTVWNTGEYPEEHNASGAFTGAPKTWIAGLGFAEAGVHMVKNPQLGTPPYVQGDAPLVNFLDCGEVYQKEQRVTVPVNSYERVLVVGEWSPLDRTGGFQLKYHAPGVGIVQVGAIDDPEGETLVLVERRQLDAPALAEVRAAALSVDQHGRQTHELYSKSQALERERGAYLVWVPLVSRLGTTR